MRLAARFQGAAIAALVLVLAAAAPSRASWSIAAVDQSTGRVAIASATCVSQAAIREIPARDLMDIQAVIVPGKGVAVVQGAADRSRRSQDALFAALDRGEAPADALAGVGAWPESSFRQFGMADLRGRSATATGGEVGGAAAARSGEVGSSGIHYAVQGDQLADAAAVDAVVAALGRPGALSDRLMAALEAGDARGGDRRCSCGSMPRPSGACETRTALVAYIAAADPADVAAEGKSSGLALSISVTDQDLARGGDANPVKALRLRYDAWRKAHPQ